MFFPKETNLVHFLEKSGRASALSYLFVLLHSRAETKRRVEFGLVLNPECFKSTLFIMTLSLFGEYGTVVSLLTSSTHETINSFYTPPLQTHYLTFFYVFCLYLKIASILRYKKTHVAGS